MSGAPGAPKVSGIPSTPSATPAAIAAFIRANTALAPVPLTPELRVFQATEVTPLWYATEETLAQTNLPPPFWAFPWAGGQAMARYLLDVPEVVAGRTVLDFAAGGGLAAIAAAKAGARRVTTNDLDPIAEIAQHLNAQANGVRIRSIRHDIVGRPLRKIAVVLAGDVFYERVAARRFEAWFRALAAAGKRVLVGDPGRHYLPRHGLEPVACYSVATPRELEDLEIRETTVWRVLPD